MIEPNMITLIAHVEVAACERQVSLTRSGEAGGRLACSGEPKALPFLLPGDYRACDDKERCTTITVAPAPSTQELTIRF